MFQQLRYMLDLIFSFNMKKLEDGSNVMFSSNMQSYEYSQSLSYFIQSAQLHSKPFPLMSQTCSSKHEGTVVFILTGMKKGKRCFSHVLPNRQLQLNVDVYRWLQGISGTAVFLSYFFSQSPLYSSG